MNSIIVKAPAKVNLFLKILSKRKDSYHNIETLFERISLVDTIRISKIRAGIIVKSDRLITRNPKENLAYKAAVMILARGKIKSGVRIEISKRIPVAAGLGGGSSDAAAVLIGINKLFGLGLNGKKLLALARKLGADVPFFVLRTPFAIGRGRGDILKAIRSRSSFWHLIIKAGSKASTKAIYEAFDAMPRCLTGAICDDKMFSPSNLRMDYSGIEAMLRNDLEEAIVLKERVTGRVLESLAHLLDKRAIVSGSGPGLFCLYRTRKEAMKAKSIVLKSLPKRLKSGSQVFVVGTYL